MSTPDFTSAQVVALVQAVIAVAVAFSLHITKQQQDAILGLSAILGSVLVWADMKIRKHRVENLAVITASQKKKPPAAKKK